MARKGFAPAVSAGAFTVVMWASLPLLRQLTALPPMLTAAVAMAAAASIAAPVAVVEGMRSGVRPADGRSDSHSHAGGGQAGSFSEMAATPAKWHSHAGGGQAGTGGSSDAAASAAVRPAGGSGRWYWIGGVGGLVGALVCYFAALPMGDPARITLVTYVWPIGFVVAASWIQAKPVPMQVVAGAAIAFAGVTPLVLADSQGAGTPPEAYAAGVAAGASWIAFSLYLRYGGASTFAAYARLFGHAALVGLLLHLVFENVPESGGLDWIAAAGIGAGPYGIAFMSWGFALRNGPTGLLGILNYFVPVIASSLLVFFGYSDPEPTLAVATLMVVAGSMLASSHWPRRRRRPFTPLVRGSRFSRGV